MEQARKVFINNGKDNLNKLIFDSKNIEINQRLNSFIHSNLKEIVGLRNYLYCFQNIIFTAINKSILAVISNSEENINNIYEKYNYQISKIIKNTWKNSDISLKYYFIKNENLVEIKQESCFIEKQNSQILFFNEANNKYLFDNFISSEENFTALEVCQSIACYIQKELVCGGNIIYLYGNEGTGKTHLVNAIDNFYKEKGGSTFVINANLFLRKYVDAIQKQSIFDFQDSILKNEIIIIEDIDNLIGKLGTLNELQKIISHATENKKYIILTSRTAPNILSEANKIFKEILSNSIALKLEDQKDALKTQIAMNYICENSINVPISIVRDLVVNIKCNVIELKNYIKKLSIIKSVKKFELNTNLALEILSDDIKKQENKKNITNDEILDIVANYYKLTSQDLKSKIKKEEICRARNVAIYFMKKINSSNFQEIGSIINRNHSTIISSLKNIETMINNDKKLPCELADLQAIINNKNI